MEEDDDGAPSTALPGMLVAAAVLGVGAWAIWRFTSDAAKTPITHDPDANPDAPPSPPTPGGGVIPPPSGSDHQAGDLVLVKSSFLTKALGVDLMSEGAVFKISIALPSLPSVTASPVTPIPLPGQPDFPGPMIVPKEEILRKVNGGAAPPTPQSPSSPGGGPVYLSDPIALTTGTRYRARLGLDSMQAAFANADLVKQQFQTLGFSNVQAWSSPSALPADWPAPERAADGNKTWFVEGTWAGAPKSMTKPSQILSVWK